MTIEYITFLSADGYDSFIETDGLGDADCPPNGDGVSLYLSGNQAPIYTEVRTDANSTSIGGGEWGIRKYMVDGQNNSSGSMEWDWTSLNSPFSAGVSEFWLRWYFKSSTDVTACSFHKMIYFNHDYSGAMQWYGGFHNSKVGFYNEGSSSRIFTGTTNSVDLLDGEWHHFQVHAKISSPNTSDGVFECWVDEMLEFSHSDVLWNDTEQTGRVWTGFEYAGNQVLTTSAGSAYTYYGPLALSDEGYISPLSSSAIDRGGGGVSFAYFR